MTFYGVYEKTNVEENHACFFNPELRGYSISDKDVKIIVHLILP